VLEGGGERRVAGRLTRSLALEQRVDAGPVGGLHRGLELLHRLDVHVGVAPLAEGIGQRLDVPQHGLEVALREHRLEDLEHCAEPAGGDAHVVHALDVGRVEHLVAVREQLVGAHADDARAGQRVRLVRVDGDLGGLRHGARGYGPGRAAPPRAGRRGRSATAVPAPATPRRG
jgi:hypothetical protein